MDKLKEILNKKGISNFKFDLIKPCSQCGKEFDHAMGIDKLGYVCPNCQSMGKIMSAPVATIYENGYISL